MREFNPSNLNDKWIIDRAEKLDQTAKMLQSIHKRRLNPPAREHRLSLDGQMVILDLTGDFELGVWKMRESIKHDLSAVGEKELAGDIIYHVEHPAR